MNELRYEGGEVVNYGRLCNPGEPRGELQVVQTPRGREIRWIASAAGARTD